MNTLHTLRDSSAHCLHQKKQCGVGFTLPELVITMAIIAILAGLAAPAFSSLIASQRTKNAGVDLFSALTKARSEALKRNTNVQLIPKSGGWQAGWEILDPSDNSRKIEDHNAIPSATIIGPAELTYLSSGRVRGSVTPTFDITTTGNSARVCVTVNLSGLPVKKSSSC